MKWHIRACPVCGGDLHDDLEDRGWVTCFLCARSFVAAQVLAQREPAPRDRMGAEPEPSLAGRRASDRHRTLKPAA